MSTSESKFQLLPANHSDEDDWEQQADTAHAICTRCEQEILGRRPCFSRFNVILTCVVVQVLIGLAGLATWWVLHQHTSPYSTDSGRDFNGLSEYNVRKSGFGPMNVADASEAADRFWSHYKALPGLVVLGDEWKDSLDLPPTLPYSDDPSRGLYQLSVFHSIHCLYRIRNRLLSDMPLDKWPRRDPHTMHCFDHIREDLMCNPDLSLRGTTDRIAFNVKPSGGVQCRNLDAIIDWAAQHVVPLAKDKGPDDPPLQDSVKVEKYLWEQKIQFEEKAGRKIGYDEFDYITDDSLGLVVLEFPRKNGTQSRHDR